MDFPLPPGAITPDPWKIRLRREALGATQAEVGEQLGAKWPAMFISRIESYQGKIDEAMLAKLAHMLDCAAEDLCSGAAEWHRNYRTAHEARPWRNVSATNKQRSADALRRRPP
jgi:transcriptional regulator with XRE-family HTH domain